MCQKLSHCILARLTIDDLIFQQSSLSFTFALVKTNLRMRALFSLIKPTEFLYDRSSLPEEDVPEK